MYKKHYLIGLLGFLGLLFLAVVFYKERMIFSDAALYIFHMLRYDGFAIFHSRFISVVPQSLPVIAQYQSFSLKAILISYSLAFPLYALVVYLLCTVLGKSYRHSLAVLLVSLLLVSDTFYWMLSELVLGTIFLMFFFSMLFRWQGRKRASLIFMVVAMPVIVFAHPFILLPFSFMVVYYWLRKDLSRGTLLAATLFFVLIFGVKLVFFRDPYDKGSLGGLRNIITLFPDYFNLYSNKVFLLDCLRKYYWLPLLGLPVIYHYFKHRSYSLLGLFVIYTLGCIFFVNVCFPSESTPAFYRENLYLPLSVFIALPFIDDILPILHRKRSSIAIFSLIVVTGLIRIYCHHSPYTSRLAYLQSYLDNHGTEKIIMSEKQEDRDNLIITWGSAYEFWLLSTLQNNRTASLMILPDSASRHIFEDDSRLFMTTFENSPYNALNEKYFIMYDTVSVYRKSN